MSRRKGTSPEPYAGVFTNYEEIPYRYRLSTYEGQYEGEDTWEQYLQSDLLERHDTEYMRESARRAGDWWIQHMDERDQHHALATPADADAWSKKLLNGDRNLRTCYRNYYVRIYQFYDWLKHSYRHPHHYNPLLLAAIEYGATRRIWMFRVDSRPEVVGRE